MRLSAFRLVWRGGLVAVAVAILGFVSLAAYCAQDTARYVFSGQPLSGSVVAIEKPVFEKHRDDFRPVVEATLPSGQMVTRRFTGLYHVPEGAVGHPIALLYNPSGSPNLVPDSALNWIGSIVYGSISAALMIVFGVLWFSQRWIAPAQRTETLNGSPALS